ncbi:YcxB family protein [Leptospira sp. 201903074]|uniref:YcxB family protein n=1 Tax=Leptospira abararensis TaxID=2810036 RepID=UPI001964E810|nr:YcxB family protein [Leptospira abararensis]MBM9548344.1 YcxB family protein [Leptospira abararensis]
MNQRITLILASVFLGLTISMAKSIVDSNEHLTVNIWLTALFLFPSIFLYKRYFRLAKEKNKILLQILKKKHYEPLKSKKKAKDYKFQFSIENKDILIFQKFVMTRFPKYLLISLSIVLIFIGALVIYGILDTVFDYTNIRQHLKYFLLSLAVIGFYFLNQWSQKISNNEIYSGPTRIGNFDFIFNESGVTRSNEYFHCFYLWDCFQFLIKNENYIYIMFSSYEGFILPIKDIPKVEYDALEKITSLHFDSKK